jgi:hypothetical protein
MPILSPKSLDFKEVKTIFAARHFSEKLAREIAQGKYFYIWGRKCFNPSLGLKARYALGTC